MQDVKRKASGLAKGSLICGICTIIPFVGIAFSLAAIIMGIVDLVKIKNGTSGASGKKFDITGIVLGLILLPIALYLFIIIIMAAPAFSEMGSLISSIVRNFFKLVMVKLGFSR